MRRIPTHLWLAAVMLVAAAAPALAATDPSSGVTWSMLDPGNDPSAQWIQTLFPVLGSSGSGTAPASLAAFGTMLGFLSGAVFLVAASFVSYNTLTQTVTASQSGQLLGQTTSAWYPVRIAMSVILMAPVMNGFSVGQALVSRTALLGIGLAKGIYTVGWNSIGPQALPITAPQVPGAQGAVIGMLNSELCRALVNLEANNPDMMPPPSPIAGNGYVTWTYRLGAGNYSGDATCGAITLKMPSVSTSAPQAAMATADQQAIQTLLTQTIRPSVQAIAQQFWTTRQASALSPLMGTFTNSVQWYNDRLVQGASSAVAQIRSQGQTDAQTAAQTRRDNLGWWVAGAYYMQIAATVGEVLAIADSAPSIVDPTYAGLGQDMMSDLNPLLSASGAFVGDLRQYVTTADSRSTPTGPANLYPSGESGGWLSQAFANVHVTDKTLNFITGQISPTSDMFQDPFARVVAIGQALTDTSLGAMAAVGTISWMAKNVSSATSWIPNWMPVIGQGASLASGVSRAATGVTSVLMKALWGMLIPGLVLAYVLPMMPFLIWTAGVMGWLIMVVEAVIAVPLWMFAHLTIQGDSLHGARGGMGYSLLFNILFRPSLMVLGLFASYFVFSAGSWVIFEGFSVASGSSLAHGWFLTNVLGVIILIIMFVMIHLYLAIRSFHLISLIPQHVPAWLGISAVDRFDSHGFAEQAGMAAGYKAAGAIAGHAGSLIGPRGGNGGGVPGAQVPGRPLSERVGAQVAAVAEDRAPRADQTLMRTSEIQGAVEGEVFPEPETSG